VLLGRIAIGDCFTSVVISTSLFVLFLWKITNPTLVAVTATIGLIGFQLLHPTWVFVR
jgi:chromate transporter